MATAVPLTPLLMLPGGCEVSLSPVTMATLTILQQPHLAASLPNLQSLRSNVRRRTELRALREEYEVLSRDLRTKGGSGNLSGFSDVWVSSFSSCAQALPGQRLEYSLNYSVFLFCPRFCPTCSCFDVLVSLNKSPPYTIG